MIFPKPARCICHQITIIIVGVILNWRHVLSKSMNDGIPGTNLTRSNETPDQRPCRGRDGYMDVREFWLHSCMKCYHYKGLPSIRKTLFQVNGGSNNEDSSIGSNSSSTTDFEEDLKIFEILYERFTEDFGKGIERGSLDLKMSYVKNLCNKMRMEDRNCVAWKRCCRSAHKCCEKMTNARKIISGHCPMTWDGYDCWSDVKANSTSERSCPTYVGMVHPEGRSLKTCDENANWFRLKGGEWTNYRPCFRFEDNIIRVIIEMTLDSTSILLLIPCVFLFLSFKELRKQFRIRIHLNFFISMFLSSLSSLTYHVLVHYDVIRSAFNGDSIVGRNPIWCRILTFLKIYFNSCTYSWMFCEALYLHSLLTAALNTNHSLTNYLIIGWTLPIVTSLSYGLLRYFHMNEKCWSNVHGLYEWITFAPNICCLLLNLMFLINIVRIIIFKLRPLPQDSSNFRKGLRAAAMLIPLFGLHILMTIYRADSYSHLYVDDGDGDDGDDGRRIADVRSYYSATYYNHVASAVLHSQGIFVSLIFCYLTEEVITHVRKLWATHLRRKRRRRTCRSSHSTQNISLTSDLKTRGEHGAPKANHHGRSIN